jgi:hypothetical protein
MSKNILEMNDEDIDIRPNIQSTAENEHQLVAHTFCNPYSKRANYTHSEQLHTALKDITNT